MTARGSEQRPDSWRLRRGDLPAAARWTDTGGRNLQIDEDALKEVASDHGAQYYQAAERRPVGEGPRHLPRNVTVTHKRVDIADVFAGVGGCSSQRDRLSLWWNRLQPFPAPSRAAPALPPVPSGRPGVDPGDGADVEGHRRRS